MLRDRTKSFAECLKIARRQGKRLDCTDPPLTIDEAYAIQADVASGTPVSGFKTARKANQKQTMAPIFSPDTYHSATATQIEFNDRIGIELEVGIKIVKSLPTLGSVDFEAEAIGCVIPFIAIELVKTRLCEENEDLELARLADNQINGGIVIGPHKPEWNGDTIGCVDASMAIGGRYLLNEAATVPGGSAMRSFANLARMIGTHCGGLRTGSFVITGSLHPLQYIDQSTSIHASIGGFGSIDVDLVKI